MGPPAGDAPAGFRYKRNPQAAAWRRCFHGGRHVNASQSPVLPRARLAYDACLNAGSTAVLADSHLCAWPPKSGAPTRSGLPKSCESGAHKRRSLRELQCTGLTPIPRECIAQNALGAENLASLTGFAPVISCMRGRRVGWTTPQGRWNLRYMICDLRGSGWNCVDVPLDIRP